MRAAKGLTQQQVAARIGCTRRTIINWEAGAYAPSARAWNRLRVLLGDDLPVP